MASVEFLVFTRAFFTLITSFAQEKVERLTAFRFLLSSCWSWRRSSPTKWCPRGRDFQKKKKEKNKKKHALSAVQSETCLSVWLHVHNCGKVRIRVSGVYAERSTAETGKVPPSHLSSCAAILQKSGANGNHL